MDVDTNIWYVTSVSLRCVNVLSNFKVTFKGQFIELLCNTEAQSKVGFAFLKKEVCKYWNTLHTECKF